MLPILLFFCSEIEENTFILDNKQITTYIDIASELGVQLIESIKNKVKKSNISTIKSKNFVSDCTNLQMSISLFKQDIIGIIQNIEKENDNSRGASYLIRGLTIVDNYKQFKTAAENLINSYNLSPKFATILQCLQESYDIVLKLIESYFKLTDTIDSIEKAVLEELATC